MKNEKEKSWGGKRNNSGKKKGSKASHTLAAQEFRKFLIDEVLKAQAPIVKALIKKGKNGDVTAIKEIFERVLGKVTLPIDLKSPGKGFNITITTVGNGKDKLETDKKTK